MFSTRTIIHWFCGGGYFVALDFGCLSDYQATHGREKQEREDVEVTEEDTIATKVENTMDKWKKQEHRKNERGTRYGTRLWILRVPRKHTQPQQIHSDQENVAQYGLLDNVKRAIV